MISRPLRKLDFMRPSAQRSEFGQRLEIAMGLAEKDRKALATHLDISVQAVGQAIRDGKFSALNTAKSARFLGVNSYWLATGEETPAVTDGVVLTEDERAVLHKVLAASTGTKVSKLPTIATATKGNELHRGATQKRQPKRKEK